MSSGWKLENTYAELPDLFFTRLSPVPVSAPKLVILNRSLALALGLNAESLEEEAARVLSGVSLPEGARPIAQAYAGHQYGHFTRLGDGRAILLGEQVDPRGDRWDIQLKGSGQTPYSRRGDGRAALGPMLREFLISEAMFALGIPSTRSLAVVATGETVLRETPLPGAILTRVAASHIRVGTFEYAAANGPEFARQLADYTIRRHFPELKLSENPYVALLRAVISRQAKLIAAWMSVGFVHGVMNTDNMAIAGETIDYGPCAFMDRYDPATVFSSIDSNGRYAYGNQPAIAQWNLALFAEALLPLLDPTEETSIEIAKDCLAGFGREFTGHMRKSMGRKLGLFEATSEDDPLIEELLSWMHRNHLDFTNTFRAIAKDAAPERDDGTRIDSDPQWTQWHARLAKRREAQERTPADVRALMMNASPQLIPRNHHVEAALYAATECGDLSPFQDLLSALRIPYEERPENQRYLNPAPASDEPYRTFCGT